MNRLYLALSCLQGRRMSEAFDALRPLGDGIQLTPGNHPTRDFCGRVADTPVRTHHGFSFTARSQPVWDGPTCLVMSDSVHPPRDEVPFAAFAESVLAGCPVLEGMYPGYRLGSGGELDWAMDHGLRLAVDVSHIQIQQEAGVIGAATWRRLQDYDRIAEIHVSSCCGTRDAHQPLRPDSFGLPWVHARLRAGTPVVLEAYLHRLSPDARRQQVDLARGCHAA